jgi:hydroxylaminobenzene mutase
MPTEVHPSTEVSGARRLILLGAVLFLLGLLSGLVTGLMANPRMGLSAHLQGITNGVFLIALGAIWHRVHLPLRLKAATFWLFAFGTSLNWLMTQLAALWGTSMMTPLIGAGHNGTAAQETVVTAGLLALTVAMITGAVLLIAGLARRA